MSEAMIALTACGILTFSSSFFLNIILIYDKKYENNKKKMARRLWRSSMC
jgi:hypothetical protein